MTFHEGEDGGAHIGQALAERLPPVACEQEHPLTPQGVSQARGKAIRAPRLGGDPLQRVDEGVAGEMDPVGMDTFTQEVLPRALDWCEVVGCSDPDHASVGLLRKWGRAMSDTREKTSLAWSSISRC